MAPTLIDIDGFAHQTKDTSQAGSGFVGIYDNSPGTGVTFDTTVKRLSQHVASLKVAQDGVSAMRAGRTIARNTIVESFYIRATAAPGANSMVMVFAGPTNTPRLILTTTGVLRLSVGSSTLLTGAINVCDGLWHLVESYIDTSATTYTMKLTVDGTSEGTGTLGSQTAANMTTRSFGSTNSGDNATFWAQDSVCSATLGDYPIGHHVVLPLYPSGEGTETLGSSNKIQDQAAGQTNLWQTVDDWNGGTPSTTDYTTYASTTTGDAASNFAEWTLSDPTLSSAVWDVIGYIAGFASATGADIADLQILTAHGGTLIDHIGPATLDYSGSTTVLGYYRGGSAAAAPTGVIARPSGGWTISNLTAAVLQWGRSTDTNGIPRIAAVMLEYAAPMAAQNVSATTQLGGAGGGTNPPLVNRSTLKAVAASLTGTPAATRSTLKAIAAALTGTPSVARSTLKVISAALSGTVSVVRQALKTVEGSSTLTPAASRATSKSVPATASLTPAAARSTTKSVPADATFAATAIRSTGKPIAATALLDPGVTRSTLKAIARAVTMTAEAVGEFISGAITYDQLVELTATFTPVAARRVGKAIAALFTASPAVTRQTGKPIEASATMEPVAARSTHKAVSTGADLTPSAARSILKTVRAVLTGTPRVSRGTTHTVSASTTLAPSASRSSTRFVVVAVDLGTDVVRKFIFPRIPPTRILVRTRTSVTPEGETIARSVLVPEPGRSTLEGTTPESTVTGT